jgi:hypothetical protein
VLLSTTARDLLLATWAVAPDRVARSLPLGIAPDLSPDGRALISLVALRNDGVRLDWLRAPSFAQLAVRTYVTIIGEPAVFLLSLRVTAAGLPGAIQGIPVRPARIRVRRGEVVAPGLGAELRYRVGGEAVSVPTAGGVPLGSHPMAAFYSAGVRWFPGRYPVPDWREATLVESPRLEPLLALGFEAREPDSVLYAEAVGFEVVLPPRKLADSRP